MVLSLHSSNLKPCRSAVLDQGKSDYKFAYDDQCLVADIIRIAAAEIRDFESATDVRYVASIPHCRALNQGNLEQMYLDGFGEFVLHKGG